MYSIKNIDGKDFSLPPMRLNCVNNFCVHNFRCTIRQGILYQCNEAIAELLTGLKLNGLTYNLLEVCKVSSNPFFADTAFMDLYKNYNEFATYYETLSKLVSIKPKGELIELDATAKANYIKEIENIKSQIPVEHKGEICKGRIRIQ